LWESVCALVVTRMWDPVPFPYRTWASSARSALRTPALRSLADWVRSWPSAEIPDFLLVVPSAERPQLADELDALRNTPAATVTSALAGRPDWHCPAFERFATAPEHSLDWLADALAEFWERTLSAWWPGVTGAIEEDILLRGRTLLVNGHDALLNGLHVRVQWTQPMLRVDAATLNGPAGPGATAAGLVLVPLLFCRDASHVAHDGLGQQAVSYQARGAAMLAEEGMGWPADTHRAATERLARLIGPTRATLCTMLATPASTTRLARELALAPSTVSEHLRTLLAAGLIDRHRAGPRVLYALSGRGAAILRTLDDAPGEMSTTYSANTE
jgi:DNA-binding transcriptional ArsR family regulator